MAFIDAYIPFNMLTGFNFSALGTGNMWYVPGGIIVDHANHTYDFLKGNIGFAGTVGTGTVTGYEFGNWSGNFNYPKIIISGLSIPHNQIVNAARTASRTDDMAIVTNALKGNDTILGSDFADNLLGFNGNDTIKGFNGNDRINGGNGNDTINGGNGIDNLTGGAGADRFLIAGNGVDFFTDFNVVSDTVALENAFLTSLGANGLLGARFHKSSTGLAHDANDRIIYETDTGWLNYDSNGSAAGGAFHIAHLAPNLALTHADFVVI